MSDERDKKIPGFTQDEENQFAAIAARSSLGYGHCRPEKDVKAQIEKDKKNMRASEEYRENGRILNEEVGPGKKYASPQDFFDTMIETLDDYGPRNTFEREAAELFLSDHGVEYTVEEKDEGRPEQSPPEPPPAPEEEIDLSNVAAERRFIMKYNPEGIAVRAGKIKWNEEKKEPAVEQKRSNLDGEASIFFLKQVLGFGRADATSEEQDYIKKIHYVPPGTYKPGCLNLDTSWKVEPIIGLVGQPKDKSQIEGAAGRKETVRDESGQERTVITHAFDHHAYNSPRLGSTLEVLYDYYRKLNPEELEEAQKEFKNITSYNPDKIFDKVVTDFKEKNGWENFVYFVSAIDSLVIPEGADWKEIWENCDRNLFAVCVMHQNLVAGRVEKLFEFFRTHNYQDGFITLSEGAIERVLGPLFYNKKTDTKKTFAEEQIKRRQQAEDFYNGGETHTLFSERYGKMLVVFGQDFGQDEQGQSRGLPGGPLAAFGHRYDAVLIWRPEKNEFHLNVRSDFLKKDEQGQARPVRIPYQLYEKLGPEQAVWVRGGMLFQPAWRSQKFGLARLNFGLIDLLADLGVDERTLSAKFKEKIAKMEKVWDKTSA